MKIACRPVFWILLLACGLGLSSCISAPKKKPPTKAGAPLQDTMSKVEIDMAAGAHDRAMNKLKKLVKDHPDTDVADDAYMAMGEIYYQKRDYRNSYDSYISVVNSDVFSPREADALVGAAKALAKTGSYDEVLSLTNKCLKMSDLSPQTRLEIYRLRFQVLTAVGDRIDALRSIIYLSENETNPNEREIFKNRAIDYVESHLSDQDLEIVAGDSKFGFVRSYAVLRIGTLLFEQRDFWKARDFLLETVSLAPETELSEKANHLLEQIEARRKVEPYTVGAVLPLSGKASNFGYKTLRGIQLGLGIYGPHASKVKLAVIDSEGNPDSARRAVERLVTEDHVISIIGSLSSKTAVAVASKADELGVPSIALSQKAGITDIGPTVFRNSLTSEMQVRQLAKVAIEDLGHKRFAILYPNDPYGVEYANLFWDEVLARGGQVVGAQPYNPKETDFSGPIQRLVGTFYLEDRAEEYRYHLREWQKKVKTVSGRTLPPTDLLPPIIEFDALFIPDGAVAVSQIAPMLAFQEVNKVHLLGTNIWNTSELVAKGERFVEGSVFVDAFFSNDSRFRQSAFFRDFQKTFKEEPGLFEAQGYDAGLMVRELIERGQNTRVGLAESLAEAKTFKGSLGTLYMNASREIERPLTALTVDKGQITPLKLAKKPTK